jgi:hypothetical protein
MQQQQQQQRVGVVTCAVRGMDWVVNRIGHVDNCLHAVGGVWSLH